VKDAGAGRDAKWKGRLGALIAIETDMDAMETTVTDLDLRDFLCTLWRTWHSDEVPSSQHQGIAALDPGVGETCTRSGDAWLENPAAAKAGTAQAVKAQADMLRLSTEGLLIEPQRTNDLTRSSFKSGLTGLTAVGTAGQSTADTTDLFFEPAESGNSLKITRNATAEDQGRTFPATAAYAANDIVVVSGYYKNDSGVAASWYLQRSSDSQYWRDSDGTWQAGIQYNATPVSTAITRFVSRVIDVGSGTPTLTLSVVHRTADANGTISHFYHLQIEEGRSATSPILTDGATVTRNKDTFTIENVTGKRVQEGSLFTAKWVGVPNFNGAEQAAGTTRILWETFVDADNYLRVFWSQSDGGFVFRVRRSAVTYDAIKTVTVTRGTAYKVVAQLSSAAGEEDLTAFTARIFVNDVKGSDVVPGGGVSLGIGTLLYVGQDNAGNNTWDGAIRQVDVRPFFLAEDETVDL
jgi:hypothetical protein